MTYLGVPMLKTFLPVVLALLPLSALADCPVPADMDQGVRLISSTGTVDTFMRLDDIQMRQRSVDGEYSAQSITAYGLYPLSNVQIELGEVVESTEMLFSYPVEIEDMPQPAPDFQHELLSKWQVSTFDGDREGPLDIRYEFGPLVQGQTGGCDVEQIGVTLHYRTTKHREFYTYLPAFGLAYNTGYQGEGEDVLTIQFTAFEAVE